MKSKAKRTPLYWCQAAVIAALYVVLTLLANAVGLSSGMIQLRISEILCLLPMLLPSSIFGVTVGCFLANLLTGAVWLDILVGPIATLIGALGTYGLRKYKWLAPLPPVLSNALIVPFVLAYGYGAEEAIPLMMLTVGIGEVLSIYLLGMIFFHAVEKPLRKLQ